MRTERKLSVYESIIENIKRDIELGIIAEGEKLPSCRDMAMRLGINPNTVQRAYSELEAQGVIYTVPKKGVYANGVTPLSGILKAEPIDKPILSSNGVTPLSGILKAEPLDEQSRISNLNSLQDSIKALKKAGVSRQELIEIIDEAYKDD